MQIVAYIIFDKRKSFVPDQMGDILDPSGEEVVHADYGMPRLQQQIGEMTPKKSGSTCNKDTHTMILLLRSSHRECHEIYQNHRERCQGLRIHGRLPLSWLGVAYQENTPAG